MFRKKVMVVKKEDWEFMKRNIYQNKQGKSKGIPKETTVLLVKNLTAYITKLAESESEELDLTSGELPLCFDADAGGGRFLAIFTFLNRKDGEVKLHPFLVFKVSDSRKNLEMTFGRFTKDIRNLEGKEVMIKEKVLKFKLYGLFDLCALNSIIGKQNHSATYPCAWTNVSKDHLQANNHAGKDHTEKDCEDVRFLNTQDYDTNLTHHFVKQGGKSAAKAGKEAGSIIATNLCPLKDMSRYIPPLMHVIMGLTNDVLKELKKYVTKADESERGSVVVDVHHKKIQEKISEMYEEIEDLEAQTSNISLAKMVVLNDLKRVPLLKAGLIKEASEVSLENYAKPKRKRKNERQSCDASLCLIFTCDVVNDWDSKISCKSCKCRIHTRCEGLAPIDDGEEMPEDYECVKCRKKVSNEEWLEDALKMRNGHLTKMQVDTNIRKTSVQSEIDHHENVEQIVSGPRQRLMKEAMVKLGDIARYHGGDLQGKQVQKLLDDAREETFEILKSIEDDQQAHNKFSRALSILANASDALKTTDQGYDEHDLHMIRMICEEWGKIWPNSFTERNITPKGHILSFVIPKSCEELKTYYKFYKVEQKGEAIHASMNDIDRKAWVIKNEGARLWKLVERYELRNVSNVEIVVPIKRVFRTDRRRTTRYI